MSDTAATARPAARSSARLGLIVRAVILTPAEGFEAADRAAERRARAAQRPAAGLAPYVLAAIGGASLFLLWLKLGALAELRRAPAASFRPAYLIAVVLLGALVGAAGQFLWGRIGPLVLGSSRGPAARSQRIAWGLAALPHVVVLFVLLPLDLVVVGPSSFTTGGLPDSVSTAWAAASIAVSVAAAIWSACLFYIGIKTMSGTRRLRTLGGVACAGLVVALLFTPLLLAARFA